MTSLLLAGLHGRGTLFEAKQHGDAGGCRANEAKLLGKQVRCLAVAVPAGAMELDGQAGQVSEAWSL